MSTITAESLSPITHNQIPVITTELLATLYATKPEYVRRNHHRNSERFVERKHYFVAKGETLEVLKESLRPFQCVAPNVRKLILWTERGAARHAKMLETDQAWEVFEKLEDFYFSHGKDQPQSPPQAYQFDGRILLNVQNGVLVDTQVLSASHYVATLPDFLQWAGRAGYLVIHEDDLKDMALHSRGSYPTPQ